MNKWKIIIKKPCKNLDTKTISWATLLVFFTKNSHIDDKNFSRAGTCDGDSNCIFKYSINACVHPETSSEMRIFGFL